MADEPEVKGEEGGGKRKFPLVPVLGIGFVMLLLGLGGGYAVATIMGGGESASADGADGEVVADGATAQPLVPRWTSRWRAAAPPPTS